MSVTKIATVTVGAGGVASIDFTSIPGTYTDLMVVYSLRDNLSGVSNDATFIVNGTTIAFRQIYGTGVNVGSNNPTQIARPIVSATATSNTFGNTGIYIPNYAGSSNKSISVDSVCETSGTESYQVLSAGVYSNATAITSLSIDNGASNFTQYSTATLYGITKGSLAGVTVS
jgi:hypothetical protein